MSEKHTLIWLSYLTKDNFESRKNRFLQSLISLQGFDENKTNIIIVDNSEEDNYSTIELKNQYLSHASLFKANNEWCDIAAHFIGSIASLNGYFTYSYDDFVFYNTNFLDDIKEMMDKNTEISCCRITKFDVSNLNKFDANITSKEENPEAVRLNNTARQEKFYLEKLDNKFYKTNLRPTSRPTFWRNSSFQKMVEFYLQFGKNTQGSLFPTLQQFEQLMYDYCDLNKNWQSAVFDIGSCYTFPQSTSVRINKGLGISKKSPVADIKTLWTNLGNKNRWF
jgi:hypothetical protein